MCLRKLGSSFTEAFINKWLKNKNGLFATNIKDSDVIDEDEVQGRETLSETLGLWMEYVLLKGDRKLFEDAYQQLTYYFLLSDGFVHWKLNEEGGSIESTNALVDDLRIIRALVQASNRWNEPKYKRVAERISIYVTKYNKFENVLTDYYDRHYNYASSTITLSYIDTVALQIMRQFECIQHGIYQKIMGILDTAPLDGPFYPKSYDVETKQYKYDAQVNLIDQSLVALYRAQSKMTTQAFLDFIKQEIEEKGVIYGKYDRQSRKPVVEYQSPAIYGWLILYSLEMEEEELAEILYRKMTNFRLTHSKYKGGYCVYQGDTHIFDNLVPMLSEQKLYRV